MSCVKDCVGMRRCLFVMLIVCVGVFLGVVEVIYTSGINVNKVISSWELKLNLANVTLNRTQEISVGGGNLANVTLNRTQEIPVGGGNLANVTLKRTQEIPVVGGNQPLEERRTPCNITAPIKSHPIAVNTTVPASLEALLPLTSKLQPGGKFKTPHCPDPDRVAIVVPYRERETQLKVFLQNIHPFLQRQPIQYTIFIVELVPDVMFNRALLMNIGFVEASKRDDYQCFIFHDVDLLPEDDANLYTCPTQPRHMSVAVDKFNYRLPYAALFGGASALTKEHFQKLNGYSNLFFGWGGEDDEMERRLRNSGLKITRYSITIARYKMIKHTRDAGNEQNPLRY